MADLLLAWSLQMQDLAKATGMAWTVVAGIHAPATDRLGPELITYAYGTARMKQLFLHEEHESLNTKAIHALTGDLTGSDPQSM